VPLCAVPLLAIFVGRHAALPGEACRCRRGGNTASRATRAQSAPGKLRPPAEDVAIGRIDAVEDSMAAGEHAGQFQA
jgi:hypothetical protein